MKFKFDPNLEFQKEAINAVIDLFDGQPHGQLDIELDGQRGLFDGGVGIGNDLVLDDKQLLVNTHAIQDKNSIERTTKLQGRNFSIEMETGTGKTYVYLRSIFELNKHYGFKKFIIVVPSVAIREGIVKSIDMMKEHFGNYYNNIPFESYLYDSKKISHIRKFRDSNNIQIMVINIQAFQRDFSTDGLNIEKLSEGERKKINVIYRDNDRLGGRPIEFIRSTNPMVIIDEPQSVDNTPKSQNAISQLNPAIVLRYSATHKNPYNLLYRLGPLEAYEQRLVKRIEIASIHAQDDYSSAYVKYIGGENTRRGGSGIRADIEIHNKTSSGIKVKKIRVKQSDDLYHKSGEHLPYRQGFIIEGIDISEGTGHIRLSGGQYVNMGESIGTNAPDIMKTMVRETIRQHLEKEIIMKKFGIKVLSLFFIDQVKNYRIYNNDNTVELGIIGRWFEECYREFSQDTRYKGIIPFKAEDVHNGYFSQDKKGRMKDTTGKTKHDEDTYSLIMREKEKLLDMNRPLRFIFSHTALKEGWDNPNVFQICTLREVGSEIERRQQIGRGLRLPVNQQGERVHDAGINRLTVVSSEGYEEYARALQNEYEQDLGIKFGIVEKHCFSKIIHLDEPIGFDSSVKIWEQLVSDKYIDSEGKILDAFDPENKNFILKTLDKFQDISQEITDEIKKRLFKNRVANAHKRKKVKFKKRVFLREDFKELWDRVGKRTLYRVFFSTDELITESVKEIKAMNSIKPIRMVAKRAQLSLGKSGVEADEISTTEGKGEIIPNRLPNIILYLQEKTQLTRDALVKILIISEKMNCFFKNPYKFMDSVAIEIQRVMKKLMLKDVQYKKIKDDCWEMRLFEKDGENVINRYIKNLYEVKNQDKTLYDSIEFESEIEKKFAKDLDNNENVKIFVKLPSWFKIDTPIGPYNPDWAFVTEREEKLYFVRETKSTLDTEKRRPEENQKIKCGHRHFKEIGVDFGVVTSLGEVEF